MTKRNKTGGVTKLGLSAKAFGRVAGEHPRGRFVLKLYVSGMTPRSRRAIDNLQALCELHLAGRYNLEIIDICQQPALAKAAQIIGDLSNTEKVLLWGGISSRNVPQPPDEAE